MDYVYPTIDSLGIRVPPGLNEEMFRAGFDHSIRGGQITKREHLKKSFRYGFREGRLYLNEYRKQHGIYAFPMKGRIKTRVK